MTKEALKLALDLATMHHTDDGYAALRAKVRSASKEALAQPEQEQEPMISKWVLREVYFDEDGEPISHRSPPQRKPLANGEIYTAYITATNQTLRAQDERLAFAFARAIEQAHGIKGDA